MKYRPDIDGLRAVAVLLVVANHAFAPSCPGGFVGVDIFFVISGYIITSLLLTEIQAGAFSLFGFYERRVRRIFPALILVLATVFAVGWFRLLPSELISLGKNTIASALFSSNLLLLSEVDYFDVAARSKPLLHIWSLGVEEQFYIVWPLLVAGLMAWRVSTRSALIIFIGASVALSAYLTTIHPAAAYYLLFTRAWELGVGAAIVLFRASLYRRLSQHGRHCTHRLCRLALLREDTVPGHSCSRAGVRGGAYHRCERRDDEHLHFRFSRAGVFWSDFLPAISLALASTRLRRIFKDNVANGLRARTVRNCSHRARLVDISLRRKSDPAPKDTRSNSWASGSHSQCSRRRHYCGDPVGISGAHPFRYQASCEYDSRTFYDEIR